MAAERNQLAVPTKKERDRITSLLIVYLTALQDSPTLTDGEWHSAEDMKARLHAELK